MTTWQIDTTQSGAKAFSFRPFHATMKPKRPNEFFIIGFIIIVSIIEPSIAMNAEQKIQAKEQVLEMFYHAYNSYMEHAYPADELMPLSCKGRFRGSEPPRGDIDDTLGNFTLTLIDTLDTLAVIGDVEGFESAVRRVIEDAHFDCDVIVSVFETNIRVLGGLLGGHVMAVYFKRKGLGINWYKDELLSRAKEVGDRLLPAFNTTTGIPYPRINLKHGVVPHITSANQDTCTACAGTMILEFAALSRLTGIKVYEEKARKAMDYLWQQRHRSSDLMGLTINIHSGDWIRRESGVGAGIDSYYEYVLKTYVLLGDDDYLARFNKHYSAVMRYMSQGPMLVDVHMHRPNAISRNFIDALLAFWPGLQVLKGDLGPAIETHEMLYQVMQRHNFLPEAFTTDFRVHWGHHPLRPEFIESTYFLYKATGDPYYLDVGKKVLDNLELHARVPCGFAAIRDVKTGTHEDQMDSYVLAEMFKYLYLLYAERDDLLFDIDDFVFTTEAHLLPLTLSVGNLTTTSPMPKIRRDMYQFEADISPPLPSEFTSSAEDDTGRRTKLSLEFTSDGLDEAADRSKEEWEDYVCPNFHATHIDGKNYAHSRRLPVKDIVDKISPAMKSKAPRLRAIDFIAGNKEQLHMLHSMGIRIATMADGRIQLLHTASEAISPEYATDGMQFMQEMIELSKQQPSEAQHDPMFVEVKIPGLSTSKILRAGPAQFGYNLRTSRPVQGKLAITRPYRVCQPIENPDQLNGRIAILERGDCMFIDKARNLQRIGAIGGIVMDHTEGTSSEVQPLFAMSGDGTQDVSIPMVFLYHKEGQQLLQYLAENPWLEVILSSSAEPSSQQPTSKECPSLQQSVTAKVEATNQSPESDTNPPVIDQAAETQLPPHLGEKLSEVLAALNLQSQEDVDSKEDPFLNHLDDKFYHHEVQLKDLYYLQTGSRYLHFNVEVRPSASTLPPLIHRQNTFSLDLLPDGSKMMTVRLAYQTPDYSQIKPQLSEIYQDSIQLLRLNTNFNDLPYSLDYARALARFLEGGYFGMSRVDQDTLTLMRDFVRNLKYVHNFDQPLAPPNGFGDGVKVAGVGTPTHKQQLDSFAQAEDLMESTDHPHADSFKEESGNKYVRVVPSEEGATSFGAHVDDAGVLNLAGDANQDRKSFSIQMTADTVGDKIVVKLSRDEVKEGPAVSFSVNHENKESAGIDLSTGAEVDIIVVEKVQISPQSSGDSLSISQKHQVASSGSSPDSGSSDISVETSVNHESQVAGSGFTASSEQHSRHSSTDLDLQSVDSQDTLSQNVGTIEATDSKKFQDGSSSSSSNKNHLDDEL